MNKDLKMNFVKEIQKDYRNWQEGFLDINFLGLRNKEREQKHFGTKIDADLLNLYIKILKIKGMTTKADLSLHLQDVIQKFINENEGLVNE